MSKFIQDLKLNIKSKTWWVTVIGSIIAISQLFGVDLTKYVGVNWKNTIDIICSLLIALGVHINITDNTQ